MIYVGSWMTDVKEGENKTEPDITKIMIFEDGLTGGENSSNLRKMLLKELKLPLRLSTNALIDILNAAIGYTEYKAAVKRIKDRL